MTSPNLPFDVCRCHGLSSALGVVCPRREQCLRFLCLSEVCEDRRTVQSDHLCSAFDDAFIPAGEE